MEFFMTKNSLFTAFRKLAKLFSGHGFRDRIPFIDKVYQRINKNLAPATAEVHGYTMYLDKGDSMGLSLNGVYEPEETALVKKYIKPGFIILDLGANIGYYSLLFSKLVGPDGKVFAFEPDPMSFRLLQQNIEKNNCSNIHAFQKAVSNKNSKAVLHRDRFNNLDHRIIESDQECTNLDIEVVRLDDFLTPYFNGAVNLVKMDIQGAEGMAFEGMEKLLAKSEQLIIFTEYWPMNLEKTDVGAKAYLMKLDQMGFLIYDLNEVDGSLKEVTVEDLLSEYPINNIEQTNLLCIKGQ